jgi:hypothetical protein
VGSTHAPPHARKPAAQAMPQVPALQVAEPPVAAGQTLPHVPQLSGSLETSAQPSPHTMPPGHV